MNDMKKTTKGLWVMSNNIRNIIKGSHLISDIRKSAKGCLFTSDIRSTTQSVQSVSDSVAYQ